MVALGLDELLFCHRGRFRAKVWGTSIVDVGRGRLLDIVRNTEPALRILAGSDGGEEGRVGFAGVEQRRIRCGRIVGN